MFHYAFKLNNISKLISLALLITFSASQVIAQPKTNPGVRLGLPPVGEMIHTTPAVEPALIKGVTVFPDNPLRFDFIVDTGDGNLEGEVLKQESTKLIKYFLASLTVPEEDLWVNLSPYEADRIIPDKFGETEMGRDLLAQDYILKQLTASLMYPEDELGEEFWNRVYAKAYEEYGITDIPVNTFNKVWIVPEKAVVYENNKTNTAFVVESRLKVMLEEDYIAMERRDVAMQRLRRSSATSLQISAEIIREIIIPAIEKEVNEGENFVQLRQIYHSLILATWFKRNLKKSVLGEVYVDQNKVAGVDIENKKAKQKIYDQYVESFKQGAYDYIKEEYDENAQEIVLRKYFSGGLGLKKINLVLSTVDTIGNEIHLDNAMMVPAFLNPRFTKAIFPPVIDFILAHECNRECSICWGSHLPSHKKVSLEDQKKIIDVMYENGVVGLAITGGEPLLDPNITEIIKYAKLRGIKVFLYTNSTLLKGQRFFDILPKIDSISISINGHDENHDKLSGRGGLGTFNEGLRTLELIKQHFPNKEVQVLTVASAKNIQNLSKIGMLLDEKHKGLNNFQWKISIYKKIGRWSV